MRCVKMIWILMSSPKCVLPNFYAIDDSVILEYMPKAYD